MSRMNIWYDLIKFNDDEPVEIRGELQVWIGVVTFLLHDKLKYNHDDNWVIEQLRKSAHKPPIEAWMFLASKIGRHQGWVNEHLHKWKKPPVKSRRKKSKTS